MRIIISFKTCAKKVSSIAKSVKLGCGKALSGIAASVNSYEIVLL